MAETRADTLRQLARVTAPLRRRLSAMVGRVVLRLVDDARKLQELQVTGLAGEAMQGVERFQQYGFSSHPLPGAEGVVVSVAGTRDHPLVIAADDRRYRPRGQPAGDSMQYTEQDDPEAEAVDALHRIQGTRDRTWVVRGERVDIRCGPTRIEMDATGITITTPRLDVVKA